MALKLAKKGKVQKVVKKAAPKQVNAAGGNAKAAQALSYASGEYIEAVGRRKVATARVRIYQSAGDFIVNDMMVGSYFRNIAHADKLYFQPFVLTGTEKKFAVTAKIHGAGTNSQLRALTHAISRALVEFNPELKGLLKAEGLLTRDDRMKETRKIGMGGKARRQRQSPKR